MELTLLTHENTAGEEIAKNLRSGKYSDFKVAVAYSRNSGISRIYNELSDFANNGGKISVIAGIDQNFTSYQALVNLKTFAKENLFVHHDKNFDITFHPKVYLFGNREIKKVIVGSSNFTAGGFFLNYEANIGVTLDSSKNAKDFQKQVSDYWDNLLNDENTKKCELTLLKKLLESGSVVDERKQKPFKDIIEKISNDLPFKTKKKLKPLPPVATAAAVNIPSFKENFAMTLSAFDVSSRSQDPVILIPVTALKQNPAFWEWPHSFTLSGGGYPQRYANAIVNLSSRPSQRVLMRIYYYDRKKEFRLQCELIKRNGKPGDIIVIQKRNTGQAEYEITLQASGSVAHRRQVALCQTRVSTQKRFGYL